jgi:pimeloyl-ACP methyl ester carboxylesterase
MRSVNKEGTPLLTFFEMNYQMRSSLLVMFVILLATLSIFMIFQINSIQIQTALAQQQPPQTNNTSIEQQQLRAGISFEIDNVTFWDHTASVNGIQLHYVIGGQGDPVVLLHGWPQTWYEWRHVMPALAKNYTVIAPDLRGLGQSSKPITGYDGKTTAEDIHQLVTKLGFSDIFLVGHDFGVQVAYSYAAAHPNETKRLVILDVPIAGIGPGGNITGLWWAQFHNVRDIPEMLVAGHEREYLTWFYRYSCNPAAITEEDIDEYVSHYSSPGGMRAGFEYYRALSDDIKQNKEYSMAKLPMPVLVLAGECSFGDAALDSMRLLATDVSGSIIPNTGHWIPEERPEFLADQLFKFFGNNTQSSK